MKSSEKFWIKFMPDKWLGDYELRTCSLEAKGMLIELMAIGFPDGYISNDEENLKNIRRTLGVYPQKFERILKELLKKNRVKIDEKIGAFYIPRMVEDHAIYLEKSFAGKKSAEARAKAKAEADASTRVEVEVEVEKEVDKKKKQNIDEVLNYLNTVTGKTLRIRTEAHRQYVSGKLTVDTAGAWVERLKRRVGYVV